MLEITSVWKHRCLKEGSLVHWPNQINRLFELRIGLWKRLALAFVMLIALGIELVRGGASGCFGDLAASPLTVEILAPMIASAIHVAAAAGLGGVAGLLGGLFGSAVDFS